MNEELQTKADQFCDFARTMRDQSPKYSNGGPDTFTLDKLSKEAIQIFGGGNSKVAEEVMTAIENEIGDMPGWSGRRTLNRIVARNLPPTTARG